MTAVVEMAYLLLIIFAGLIGSTLFARAHKTILREFAIDLSISFLTFVNSMIEQNTKIKRQDTQFMTYAILRYRSSLFEKRQKASDGILALGTESDLLCKKMIAEVAHQTRASLSKPLKHGGGQRQHDMSPVCTEVPSRNISSSHDSITNTVESKSDSVKPYNGHKTEAQCFKALDMTQVSYEASMETMLPSANVGVDHSCIDFIAMRTKPVPAKADFNRIVSNHDPFDSVLAEDSLVDSGLGGEYDVLSAVNTTHDKIKLRNPHPDLKNESCEQGLTVLSMTADCKFITPPDTDCDISGNFI